MNNDFVLKVPGMLTSEEKLKLVEYASRCDDGSVLELGCFFGASTVALATGLIQNNWNVSMIAVDAFKVATSHPFAKRVIEYANLYGLEHAIVIDDDDCIDFSSVCKSFLHGWSSDVCTLIQKNIDVNEKFEFAPRKISLLHLDLPKDAVTMEPIAKHVFPLLSDDAVVAFQDHGYHFSGELIAFFEYLMATGFLRMEDYCGSTIYARVCCKEPLSSTYFLKALYTSQIDPLALIESAIRRVSCIAGPRAKSSLLLALAYTHLQTSSQVDAQVTASKAISSALNIGDQASVAIALAEMISEKPLKHIS